MFFYFIFRNVIFLAVPAIMSGFYRDSSLNGLAEKIYALDAMFGDPSSFSPDYRQLPTAMSAQADADAACARVLAYSKQSVEGGKSGKDGKGGKGGKDGNASGNGATPSVQVDCRNGVICTRPGCAFQHPAGFIPICTMGHACLGSKVCPYRHTNVPKAQSNAKSKAQQTQCRYSDTCNRSDCRDTHPNGSNRSGLRCKNGASCRGKKSGKCRFKHP